MRKRWRKKKKKKKVGEEEAKTMTKDEDEGDDDNDSNEDEVPERGVDDGDDGYYEEGGDRDSEAKNRHRHMEQKANRCINIITNKEFRTMAAVGIPNAAEAAAAAVGDVAGGDDAASLAGGGIPTASSGVGVVGVRRKE
uniref:Uncharacterized protein n=1 Tax=Lotharella oceanica TaxID=641309 RepID=A0A7S2U1U7_9EUKA|mmetsp:Transcript_5869/g.11645  ORF Transcript_5869/g.11645 Transcript_5869/m.11645 type:complete len:139 (+) Transcript_5869:327-743(+)